MHWHGQRLFNFNSLSPVGGIIVVAVVSAVVVVVVSLGRQPITSLAVQLRLAVLRSSAARLTPEAEAK